MTPLCWFYNPEKIHLKAQGVEYVYPNSISDKKEFIDPLNNLIGFVMRYEVYKGILFFL